MPNHRVTPWLVIATCTTGLLLMGCGEPAQPPAATKAPSQPATKSPSPAAQPTATAGAPPTAEKLPSEPAATESPNGKVVLGTPELTAGIPGQGPLTIEQIQEWLADPRHHEPLDFELPLGLKAGAAMIKGVEENPLTRAKIELGRQLYFDTHLSANNTISCASCHDPDEGYTKHTQFGIGIDDQVGARNSPVSYNRIFSDLQFWDGRAASLEEQATGPIANPIEMGNTHGACVECLAGIEGYRLQFEKIFGELTIDTVAQAIASFERAIVTGPSPFDYYEYAKPFRELTPEDLEEDPELAQLAEEAIAAAEAHPMSESAIRGRELFFGKAKCTQCHVGANLSDEKYHNIGVGMDADDPDLGRYNVTKEDKDRGAFKTPTIRNVALSAPYMHDGSHKTLEEVVEWYDKGGFPHPYLDKDIQKLNLTEQEKKDLVEFMKACTGEFPPVEEGRLPQ